MPKHRTLFFHHAKGKALRHGDWKIVSENRGQWELYNLDVDPLELNNLGHTKPEKLKELVTIWNQESKRLAQQAK